MRLTGPHASSGKVTLSRVGRLAVVFVGLILAFVLALSSVFALPQDPITKNLRLSLPQIQAEGMFPTPFIENPVYKLDTYTDAQMLDIAMASPSENPLQRAMAMRNGTMSLPSLDPIAALSRSLDGHKGLAEPYAYYWHGYQVLLRPSLLLLNYSDIRFLNLLCLGAMALALGLFMRDKAGRVITIAYLLTLLAMGFYVVPASLQFSSVVYVTFLATFAVVVAISRWVIEHADIEIFFVTGMLTTFFDLLTAPLLSLGLPLAVAIAMLGRRDRDRTTGQDAALVARASIAWAAGYALAWMSKAVLATVLLQTNVIARATASLLLRSGIEARGTMITSALRRNLLGLYPLLRVDPDASGAGRTAETLPVLGITLLVGAAIVSVVVANRKPVAEIIRSLHVLLVVPLPYLWFVVMSNHSAVHYWYSYRIQAIAVFPIIYILISALDVGRVGKRLQLLREKAR